MQSYYVGVEVNLRVLIPKSLKEFIRVYKRQQKLIIRKKNYRKTSTFLGKSSENIKIEEAEFLILLIYLHCPKWRDDIIEQLDQKDLVFTFKPYRFFVATNS